MSVKFPIKDDRMQSLYGLAWSKLASGGKGAQEQIRISFEAVESGAEEVPQPEEAVLLDAPLAIGRRADLSPEEVHSIRNRERMEAQRDLHLMQLGYIGS